MFDRTLDTEHPFEDHADMDRTYVRRRRMSGALLLSLTLALGVPAAANALRAGAEPIRPVAAHRYVVRQGDTLWTIASRVSGERDPRLLVEQIAQANHLDGASIVPGQVLSVPAG
jgi:hypothetical protein